MRSALSSVPLAAIVLPAGCQRADPGTNPAATGGSGGSSTGVAGSSGTGGADAGEGGGPAGAGGAGGAGGADASGRGGAAGGAGEAAGGAGGAAGAGGICQAPATSSSLFADVLGKSAAGVDAKVDTAFQSLFYGNSSNNTIYYEVGATQAYILDVGNNDVRTEGMSYGMMIAVQLDKKNEFDRIWSWAKQYMYQSSGSMSAYFAWHRSTAGAALSATTYPAPDGEEYFATALIFASKRWGDGTGIFDYASEARALLDVMVHKGESTEAQAGGITSMFDPTAKLVVFVPNAASGSATFTDPWYVMPAFYDVWACFDAGRSCLPLECAAAGRSALLNRELRVSVEDGRAPRI